MFQVYTWTVRATTRTQDTIYLHGDFCHEDQECLCSAMKNKKKKKTFVQNKKNGIVDAF